MPFVEWSGGCLRAKLHSCKWSFVSEHSPVKQMEFHAQAQEPSAQAPSARTNEAVCLLLPFTHHYPPHTGPGHQGGKVGDSCFSQPSNPPLSLFKSTTLSHGKVSYS